jgi:16S rRNA (cytosine967-C5)-methyltransferase
VNTRRIAAKVISRTLKQGQSLTVALDNTLETVTSSQDKAFIQALCYGTLRYFHRLDFILKQLLKKPVKDEEIKALILIGLYQLQYMRVKPHAAVSETVAALSKKKQHAKALINAILRRYLREQQDLELAADQQPSAANSHPKWLIRLITTDWPEQQQAILLQNNLQAPMVLRVNTQMETLTGYQQKLLAANISAETSLFCPAALLLQKPVNIDELPGFEEGRVSVQDAAAQLAAGLLDLQAGHSVLDVCAAPGGKLRTCWKCSPI